METPNPEVRTQPAPQPPASDMSEPAEPAGYVTKKEAPSQTRFPAIIVGVVVATVAALSIWYLVRPQPLLVQGEVDATRFDIAARVDGRVGEVPVERGQNVAAGAGLGRIDNPEKIAKNEQSPRARVRSR